MTADDAWFWLNKCKFLAVILQVSTAKGNLLGGSAPLCCQGFLGQLGQPWRACGQDFFSSRRMQVCTAMSSANMSWTAGQGEFVWIFLNQLCVAQEVYETLRWTIFRSATPPTPPRAWGRARQAREKQGDMWINWINLEKSGSSAAETLIHFAGLVVTAEAEAAVAKPGVVRAAAAAAAAEAAEAACGAAAANENEKLQLVWNFVKPWTFHCSTPNFFSMFRLVHRDPWINNCSSDTVLGCYAIWSFSKDCVAVPKRRELACM